MKLLACIFLLAACASARGATCTEDDKKYLFTPCNPVTNTKQSVQYYDKACDPSSSDPLDAPRSAACYITCRDGQFYSPKTLACLACPAGSSSQSVSTSITNFNALPDYAMSFCSPAPCAHWKAEANGNIFSSGNQSTFSRKNAWGAYDETVESAFVIIVDIVDKRGGAVKFAYRVESEKNFDGLAVHLDGQAQVNDDHDASGNSRYWASGIHYQWRIGVVLVPVGKHQVKFSFTKDSNQQSSGGLDVGNDRAYLKDVTLIGVQSFAEECQQCPMGTYAPIMGSEQCLECEANTYAGYGSAECTHCLGDEWAPSGSGACFKKLTCTKDDYVAMYGQCDSHTLSRHRMWRLINSRCLVDQSTKPKDGDVACASCMPGMLLNLKTGACSRCPEGSALMPASGKCEKCPAKTAAIPIWDFSDGFDHLGGILPAEFATQTCSGSCIDCSATNHPNGDCFFELASYPNRDSDGTIVGIRQSQYMGNYYTAQLAIPLQLISDGTIEVTYAFVHTDPDSTDAVPSTLNAMITIDGVDHQLDDSRTLTVKPGKIKLDIKQGERQLLFTVVQDGVIELEDRFDVVLLSVKVVGELRGGNPTCVKCTAGHYCPGNTESFVPCPPGYYNYAPNMDRCVKCQAGYAQKDEGSQFCNYCGTGTYTNDNQTLCINSCNISSFAGNWDLTGLRGLVFGPLTKSNLGDAGGRGNSGGAGNLSMLPPVEALDTLNIERFFVSPCNFVNENKCMDRTCTRNRERGSTVEDAYACQRINANLSYSLGDDVSYTTYNGKLTQYLTGGDKCHSSSLSSLTRRTNITFVCDPTEVPGTLSYINEYPSCQFNFALNSRYGCPVCSAASFQVVTSDCGDDEFKVTKYYKRSDHSSCVGGFVPPADVKVSCRKCTNSDYEIIWSDCENGIQKPTYELKKTSIGCIDAKESQLARENSLASISVRECRKIDATIGNNSFTVGLFFVTIGIASAVAAAYVFYKRHADLSVRYQRLNNNATGHLEMADHDDFGHDEEEEDDGDDFSNQNAPAKGAATQSSAVEDA